MTEMNSEEYRELRIDVLTEISNVGTGNAAHSLSSMLSGDISIEVPVIRFLEFKDLAEAIDGAENTVVGIMVNLQRDLNGMVMFLMDIKSANGILNNLFGRPAGHVIEEFSEMELSALNELGNVMAGAYLSAISTLTGLSAATTVPEIAIDMAGAIMSVPAIAFGKISDRVLLIQSEIKGEGINAMGNFILTPTEESFDKIFNALWA
ncbi:MAG: chemotaxis protein CheC [Lachnospiraceae bacterium]|nr:chemotaxis protein CheC [Lachnospiraceae bacterium]